MDEHEEPREGELTEDQKRLLPQAYELTEDEGRLRDLVVSAEEARLQAEVAADVARRLRIGGRPGAPQDFA